MDPFQNTRKDWYYESFLKDMTLTTKVYTHKLQGPKQSG